MGMSLEKRQSSTCLIGSASHQEEAPCESGCSHGAGVGEGCQTDGPGLADLGEDVHDGFADHHLLHCCAGLLEMRKAASDRFTGKPITLKA